jgi:hypothetical protein
MGSTWYPVETAHGIQFKDLLILSMVGGSKLEKVGQREACVADPHPQFVLL